MLSRGGDRMINGIELAVVGCGPAGLSAAINGKIRKKEVLIFGLEICSPKLFSAPQIDNYLGLPKISGKEMQKKIIEHANELGLEIKKQKVDSIFKVADHFIIQAGQSEYKSESVVIATGVTSKNLFPGEEELLGKGVGYCATCDGQLYKDKKVAVISYIKEGEEEAEYLASFCKEVIFIPIYKDSLNPAFKSNIKIVKEGIPVRIEGEGKVEKLILDSREISIDGLFILRDSVPPEKLVPEIKIENNAIVVNKNQETNIEGLYAAGDCSGTPYQLAKAVGEGQIAALSAVKYLDKRKHNKHQKEKELVKI